MLPTRKRAGFTLVECAATLAVIAAAGIIVAQLIAWSFRHRTQLATRQAAIELTANVLETARTQPFDKLDKKWADAQAISSDMTDLLPGGKVVVHVLPVSGAEKSSAKVTRVTVEVHWQFAPEAPGQSVQLTSVFSDRSAKKGGAP